MDITLSLSKQAVEKFCEDFNCSKGQIEPILMSYFNNDVESENYRNMKPQDFDLDNFLVTHPPAVLLTMRANALTKRKIFIEN